MGRDLVLKPRQSGEPVNFLIYPYVEVDGKPLRKEQIKLKTSSSTRRLLAGDSKADCRGRGHKFLR